MVNALDFSVFPEIEGVPPRQIRVFFENWGGVVGL